MAGKHKITRLNAEEIFEIKQKFLRTVPHPKLILKQINRLNKSYVPEPAVISKLNLKVFLEKYISDELSLKLTISNAKETESLERALISLMDLHSSLISKLADYYSPVFTEEPAIKQSDSFDVYNILKNLNEFDLHETEIKKYLCDELKTASLKTISPLGIAVVRAKKIETYGR